MTPNTSLALTSRQRADLGPLKKFASEGDSKEASGVLIGRRIQERSRFKSERLMVVYLFEVYLLVGSAVAVVVLALWVSFYLALLAIAVTTRFLRVRPPRTAGDFRKLAELRLRH